MKTTIHILTDITKYTVSHYIASFLNVVRSIFTRGILGPLTMGFFAELSLYLQYGRMHHLGILNAMEREIPYHKGKSDHRQISLTQSVSLSVSVLTAILVSSFFALVGLIGGEGFYFIAILVLINGFLSYYQILLRTHNEFSLISKVTFYASLVETTLTLVLVYVWQLRGLFIALIVGDLLWVLWVIYEKPDLVKIPFILNKQCLKSLFRVGVPISIYNFIRTIFLTVDRIFILAFLGQVYLGFYTIAMMVYNFITPLPSLACKVLYPRFMQVFGKTENLGQVEHYLTKPTLAFGYCYPVIAGLGVLVLPIFIHYLLPQFAPGLVAAQILLWGSCCYALIFMWVYSIIALERQWLMIGLTLFSILIEIGLCFLFVSVFKWGLIGISMATSLAHFFLSIFLISSVIWGFQKQGWKCVVFLLKLYIPLIGAIGSVWLIGSKIHYTFNSPLWDIALFLLQLLMFAGIWGVFMFYKLNQLVPVLKVFKEWRSYKLAMREVEV